MALGSVGLQVSCLPHWRLIAGMVAGDVADFIAGNVAGIADGRERMIKTAPGGTACRKARPVPGSHLRGLGCGEVGGRVVAGMAAGMVAGGVAVFFAVCSGTSTFW